MMDTATHCAGDEITNKAVTQGASQCWNVNVHNIYTNKQMDKLLLIIYYRLLSEHSSFIISYDYSPLYQVINSHVKHKIWIKRVLCLLISGRFYLSCDKIGYHAVIVP